MENCKTLQGLEMNAPDTHWQRQLHSFGKALLQLDEAMELMSRRPLSKLERQGAFHVFECSYELSWNTLKDFLIWQGIEGIVDPRDTIRDGIQRRPDRRRTGLDADADRPQPHLAHLQRRNRRSDPAQHPAAASPVAQGAGARAFQPGGTERMTPEEIGLPPAGRRVHPPGVRPLSGRRTGGALRLPRQGQLPPRLGYRPDPQGATSAIGIC